MERSHDTSVHLTNLIQNQHKDTHRIVKEELLGGESCVLFCVLHELDNGNSAVPMPEGENFDFGRGMKAPE